MLITKMKELNDLINRVKKYGDKRERKLSIQGDKIETLKRELSKEKAQNMALSSEIGAIRSKISTLVATKMEEVFQK